LDDEGRVRIVESKKLVITDQPCNRLFGQFSPDALQRATNLYHVLKKVCRRGTQTALDSIVFKYSTVVGRTAKITVEKALHNLTALV